MTTSDPIRLWIDTDIGTDVDDALTLAYALRHPGFEVVGVSTVFGDVELRADIASEILAMTGEPQHREVPVLPGLAVPLSPHRKGLMFGHEGAGILEDPVPRLKIEEDPEREQRLAGLARSLEAVEPDLLLAIGPLTNLAALVERGAALPKLAIMGGKLQDVMLEGMLDHIPEWNWFCDPKAVQIVIEAQHREIPRVVPVEVTFTTRLAEGDVELLAGGDELARSLSKLSAIWLDVLRKRGAKRPRVALHDPLTAATLVEAKLCRFEERCIVVDDIGASAPGTGAANVEAAIDVDNDALRDHLMATWLG